MKDNLAKRVRESYRLDDYKFREIVDTLHDAIVAARRASEAAEMSKPHIVLDLSYGQILIRAEYHAGNESNTVLFNYIGRLVDGSKVDKPGSLYLQTFNAPEPHPAAVPNPDLVELLRQYII